MKVEFGAWLWLGNDCTSGDVYIEVACSGGPAVKIAESEHVDAASAPHGRWIYLHTEPLSGFDARITASATSISVILHADAPGTLWLDDVRGGAFEHAEFAWSEPSFENPGALGTSWSTVGKVSVSTPADSGAYFGQRFARLSGAGYASVSQMLAVDDGRASPAPRQSTEAGAWVFVENGAALPAQPDARAWIKLRLLAWTSGTPLESAPEIAATRWNPTIADKETWTFLETQLTSSPQIPFEATHLVVVLEKSIRGTIRADFVQAGERFAINGNPRRQVGCNYAGWFRSPLFPGTTTNPTSPSAIWRNWSWTSPPACDPSSSQLFHNPDCATSPQCYRVNARRNGAASVESSIDQLPIAGAYDSRDPTLLGFHVGLARAIGIDSFVYDYQGHTLAMQLAAQGDEPVNEQAFEALLDAVDARDSDLKVAVMYEPKVHFQGWVQNEPTLASKLLGIENDLIWLSSAYSRRRAMQKHDGRLVVYVFRNNICNAAGTQCMNDARWNTIHDRVRQATGMEICLVADAAPSLAPGSSVFRGMARWDLVSLELLQYRTYSDFANRLPSWPPATPQSLFQFAASVSAQNAQWAAADDRERFSVAMAWPGFDDSGVAGWSTNNLAGSDGNPLCVRVAADLAGAFHAVTWLSALESHSDWIQLATWNDWNEGTQIEPSWDLSYSQAALASTTPSPAALQSVFRRAYEAQSAIAAFKGFVLGQELRPADLETITTAYLRAASFQPGVTKYD
ncbi:MAG TPA: hypothetical protein VM509_14720 [Planctomycetota bacterium]|nr:hypothetical protein [Planctomycetota bacterium]